MRKHLLLVVSSLVLHAFGYVTLSCEIEPFQYFFYATSWWSFIIMADAVLAVKKGNLSILNGRLFFIICISSGYWCIFEALNIRLHNWRYIGLPEQPYLRYLGYFLSYGTVIPALYVAKELVRNLLPADLAVRALPVPARYPLYAISSGLLCLLMVLAFPVIAFPLAWVFLTLIIDGYNYLKGYRSFAGDLKSGYLTDLTASMAAGLACGFMWEAWNYRAASKWIYTLPFLQDMKIFEMPLAGYLGFPVFGIGTVAFVNLLDGLSKDKTPLSVPAIIALAFSFTVFPLIDRYTVLLFPSVLYR